MKLKTLVATAAVGLGAFASSAFAQFDGIYVGAGVGFFKPTGEFTAIPGPGTGTVGAAKHQGGINLNVGYGMTVDSNWNLAGEFSYTDKLGTAQNGGGATNTELNLGKAWAVSFLPGYKVANNVLVFGRIGYAQAKLDGSALSNTFANGGISTLGGIGSQKHTGIVWGVGTKVAFNKNVSGVIEWQFYDLKKKDYTDASAPPTGASIKPTAAGLMLGVQYAF